MDVKEILSVGTLYQNIAFYTFLAILACLNVELLWHGPKQRDLNTTITE